MIEATGLSKTFRVAQKAPGLLGSIQALVRRRYVVKQAVRSASFRVEEGEIVGLVGPNGAGKTTLVKLLAGIIHPSGGDAKVLGFRPWERSNDFRRQVALLMGQKAQLWWDLPAADGFLLLQEIYRVPEREFQERLAALTALLGVGDHLRTPVRRLSLGERMKMELIAALLHGPRVVFLDEPTIGLDLTAQRAVREFLLRYRQEHRPAMLLTSHYMEDIQRLCERVLLIREGEIIYDGRLDRIVELHADARIVTAHLRADAPPPPASVREALERVGEVLELSETAARLRVPRERVAEGAACLLQRLSVADLTIEGPDVGTVIERLLGERPATAAPPGPPGPAGP